MKAIPKNAQRYMIFIIWLLHDSLWKRKRQAIIMIGTSVIGVVLQAAAIGLVVYYAQHFASGETIDLAGYRLDTRASLGLISLSSLVMVALLITSAFCLYYSRRAILRMGREYEEYCAKRVFHRLSTSAGMPLSTENPWSNGSYLFRLVKSDSRFAARALRKILSTVVPTVTLIIAVAVLFKLEAALTFLITCLGGIMVFCQYRVSRCAAHHSKRFETLSPIAGAEYKALIRHCTHQPWVEVDSDRVELLFRKGSIRKQFDAYEGRLQAVENSRLISGLFAALAIGLITLVMGSIAIRTGSGWGRLIVYVVALRFAMVNLKVVFSSITAINRFYPQVRRYFVFLQSFGGKIEKNDSLRGCYLLDLEDETSTAVLDGTLPSLVLQRGMAFALTTSLELNRYTLAIFCSNLLGADEPAVRTALHASRFAAMSHSCPTSSLRNTLGLSSEAKWDDLRVWFPDEVRWQKTSQQLPKNLDKMISSKQWARVTPELKFVLSLISAKMEGCEWIFMQAEGLHRLGPDAARFYIELFADAICVIVYDRDYRQVGSFGEQCVAVVNGERLLGMGSVEWFAGIHDAVMERLDDHEKSDKRWRCDPIEDDETDD